MKKILLSEDDLTIESRPYFNLAVQPSINRHTCVEVFCSRCWSVWTPAVTAVKKCLLSKGKLPLCQRCRFAPQVKWLEPSEVIVSYLPFLDFDKQEWRPETKSDRKYAGAWIPATCSECGEQRLLARGDIVTRSERGRTLMCNPCAQRMNGPLKRGERHYNWKGGRWINYRGYVELLNPEHPAANRGYVLEHRIVMEQALGRYLYPWEEVHHKNSVRTDNAPENLELWVVSHPSGVRLTDYHCPGCICDGDEIHTVESYKTVPLSR